MTSKTYFTIATIFIALYIGTSFGGIVGLPDWVHQVCTLLFVSATVLGLRQKKLENPK
jgi:uncharacterized membrane protein YhdT